MVVAEVLVMLEVASQMTVTTVLSVRAGGLNRNATSTETAMLFEHISCHIIHDQLRFVLIQQITPDPTARQAHHQLGDVERIFQILKTLVEKLQLRPYD